MPENRTATVLNAPSLHDVILEVLVECTRNRNLIFRPSEFSSAVTALRSDLHKLGIKVNVDEIPGLLDKIESRYLENDNDQPWILSKRIQHGLKFTQYTAMKHRERNTRLLSNSIRKKLAETFAKALAQARKN